MIVYRRFMEEFHKLTAQIRGLFVLHVLEWLAFTVFALWLVHRLP